MLQSTLMLLSWGLSVAFATASDRLPPPMANGAMELAGASPVDAAVLADRLRLAATPLKWRELVTGDARVIYIGDTPMHRETKHYLAAAISDLSAAGVTHLAIELSESHQPELGRFCSGYDRGGVAEALGASMAAEDAAGTLRLLRAACAAGLRLLAVEPKVGGNGEAESSSPGLVAMLAEDRRARVLALLKRERVAADAEPAALMGMGFRSRSYVFLTNGLEGASAGSVRVADPQDRRQYLALDAAGLRNSALLLPCPPQFGAHGCLALPEVLDETAP